MAEKSMTNNGYYTSNNGFLLTFSTTYAIVA